MPSPKFQLHAVTGPVDWSLNWTASGAWPELGFAEKLAFTGDIVTFVTVIARLALLVCPLLPVTVKVAVKFPALL